MVSPRPPIQAPVIAVKTEEPRVMLTVEQQKISFLPDTGNCFLVLSFSPEPRSQNKVTVWGILGQPLEHYFTQPFAYSNDFCHSFLIVLETLTLLLG
jgi:hypothetical protein